MRKYVIQRASGTFIADTHTLVTAKKAAKRYANEHQENIHIFWRDAQGRTRGRTIKPSKTTNSGRRRNPKRESKAVWFDFAGSRGGPSQLYHNVKAEAQEHANQTGKPVTVKTARSGGAFKAYSTVKPTLGNSGRGKWMKVKAVRIKNGVVQVRK